MNDTGCTHGTGEYRSYRNGSYKVVVIDECPGAPGGKGEVASALSVRVGVLVPSQNADTVSGYLKGLYSPIFTFCGIYPESLAGYSSGAWPGFLFAASYTSLVSKLILISAGAFDTIFNNDLTKIKLDRLEPSEKSETIRLFDALQRDTSDVDLKSALRSPGELIPEADTYEKETSEGDPGAEIVAEGFRPEVYRSVRREAQEMRNSGNLLQPGTMIRCLAVAIHGDCDPHHNGGVRKPLSHLFHDCRFILLKRRGHNPWKEKYARDDFFKTIKEEFFEESERNRKYEDAQLES